MAVGITPLLKVGDLGVLLGCRSFPAYAIGLLFVNLIAVGKAPNYSTACTFFQ
jgi:hypothetical protein